jgi:hypothetical protein
MVSSAVASVKVRRPTQNPRRRARADYRLDVEALQNSGNPMLCLFVMATDYEHAPAEASCRGRAGRHLPHTFLVHQTHQEPGAEDSLLLQPQGLTT